MNTTPPPASPQAPFGPRGLGPLLPHRRPGLPSSFARRPGDPLVLTPAGGACSASSSSLACPSCCRSSWPRPLRGSGLSLREITENRSLVMEHPALFPDLPFLAHRHRAFALSCTPGGGPGALWGLIHSVAGRLRRSLLLPYPGLGLRDLRYLLRSDGGGERCVPARLPLFATFTG